MLPDVSANWFKDIWGPRGSLSTGHIDALLGLLIYYRDSKFVGDSFLNDWTVMDELGTCGLMSSCFESFENRILSFVHGFLPQQGSKRWSSIEKVYGVAHVDHNHWVLYCVVLKEQSILVFDPLGCVGSRKSLHANAFANMTKNLDYVCAKGRIYNHVERKHDWDVESISDLPRQENISDCGVMVLKYLCLITEQTMTSIVPSHCPAYRKGYCYELFCLASK